MAALGQELSQALHGHCTASLLGRPAPCSLVPASHPLSELQPRHVGCLCRLPWLGNVTPNQHRRNDPVWPLSQGEVQKPRDHFPASCFTVVQPTPPAARESGGMLGPSIPQLSGNWRGPPLDFFSSSRVGNGYSLHQGAIWGPGKALPPAASHPLLKTAWAEAESLIHSKQGSLALPRGPCSSAWMLALKRQFSFP